MAIDHLRFLIVVKAPSMQGSTIRVRRNPHELGDAPGLREHTPIEHGLGSVTARFICRCAYPTGLSDKLSRARQLVFYLIDCNGCLFGLRYDTMTL